MKRQTAKSPTADLFAAPPPVTQRLSLEPLRAAGAAPRKQLWYAVVFEAEPSASLIQRLSRHALRFTSFVSIEPPNALLLELKGSLQLFGSLKALHADIDAGWRRLALPAHSATAPSTLAALWLARAGHPGPVVIDDVGMLAGQLARLPIACTAWDGGWLQTLRAMGVTRVGELLRLPRAGLARRLGPAAVQDLDIALARQPAPRRSFVPRERFRERCDFETEVENVAYLEKALEPLIERCVRFLRERQAGVQTLQLKLRHRTGPPSCVQLGLASITGERRRLTDVLTQKLARLELAAPVRSLELTSGSLRALAASSLDAFAGLAGAAAGAAGSGGRDSAPQLVERLRARLGEDAVYGVVSIAEHRPEAAWRRVHELRLAHPCATGDGIGGAGMIHDMPRPVWLLHEALPLCGPQSHERHRSGLILEQGPERIESGWWDGKGVARDYYIARQIPGAQQFHGARLWVFQERNSKRWYVHGVFA